LKKQGSLLNEDPRPLKNTMIGADSEYGLQEIFGDELYDRNDPSKSRS